MAGKRQSIQWRTTAIEKAVAELSVRLDRSVNWIVNRAMEEYINRQKGGKK